MGTEDVRASPRQRRGDRRGDGKYTFLLLSHTLFRIFTDFRTLCNLKSLYNWYINKYTLPYDILPSPSDQTFSARWKLYHGEE